MSDTLRCPKCNRLMEKITNAPYLLNGAYFYTCKHCEYISDIMTENNIPFGENYPSLKSHDENLNEWNFEKKEKAIIKLKKENVKIINKMFDEYGLLTDDDMNNLKIWLWECTRKKKTSKKLKTKKKGK